MVCPARTIHAKGYRYGAQGDVTWGVKAVVAAGVEVAHVEVDKQGRITVAAGKPPSHEARGVNEWDRI
jgi:hypothetical protein